MTASVVRLCSRGTSVLRHLAWRYTLLARALLPADVVSTVTTAGPQIYWASTELSVDGDNLSGLLLTLTPGLTVKGRVRFEGTLPPPSDLGTIRVMLQAVQNGDAVSSTPSAAKVDAAGQFVLTGITPAGIGSSPPFQAAARLAAGT